MNELRMDPTRPSTAQWRVVGSQEDFRLEYTTAQLEGWCVWHEGSKQECNEILDSLYTDALPAVSGSRLREALHLSPALVSWWDSLLTGLREQGEFTGPSSVLEGLLAEKYSASPETLHLIQSMGRVILKTEDQPLEEWDAHFSSLLPVS